MDDVVTNLKIRAIRASSLRTLHTVSADCTEIYSIHTVVIMNPSPFESILDVLKRTSGASRLVS